MRSSKRWVPRVPATDSGATTTARRPLVVALDPGDVVLGAVEQPLRGGRRSSTSVLGLLLADRVGVVGLDLADRVDGRAGRPPSSSGQGLARARRAGRSVIRPAGASASADGERVAGLHRAGRRRRRRHSGRRGGRPARRAPGSARPARAEVTRSASSCASSMTSSLCGGTMCRPASMSTASRLWLVTTMSASRARAREASAKHSAPYGQRAAPTHSRAGIETSRQAESSTPGSSSSRSPVSVSVGPVAQPLDLLAEPAGLAEPLGRLGLADVEERVVGLLRRTCLQLGQAEVVVPALEHGEGRAAAEQRLDRVGQPGQVVVDELGLQGQGGGGDHHRAVDEQRRHQVGQGLAGARAGLHEQVLAGLGGPRDRPRPSPAGRAAPRRRAPRRRRRRAVSTVGRVACVRVTPRSYRLGTTESRRPRHDRTVGRMRERSGWSTASSTARCTGTTQTSLLGEDDHGRLGRRDQRHDRAPRPRRPARCEAPHVLLFPRQAWWTACFNAAPHRTEIYCDITTPCRTGSRATEVTIDRPRPGRARRRARARSSCSTRTSSPRTR